MMGLVFRKEFTELMRDRKHLLVTVLLPILITPLLMVAVAAMQVQAESVQAERVFRYSLLEEAPLSGLRAALQANTGLKDAGSMATDTAVSAVTNDRLDMAIRVFLEQKQWVVELTYKDTDQVALKRQRIETLVTQLNAAQVSEQLAELGIQSERVEAFLQPVRFSTSNVATQQESLGQLLGNFLPFLIILWLLSSATAISSDLVAGEKERGTLETLLISPVPLLAMVMGKWLAITLSSWLAGALTLLSLWCSAWLLVATLGSDAVVELMAGLSLFSLVAGLVILLPTAGLVAAAFLASSTWAQSFKEAQTYASGLMILFFIPLFANLSGTVDLTWLTALIPVLNASLVFAELLKGSLMIGFLLPMVLADAVVILVILAVAVALYRSERVLVRQ